MVRREKGTYDGKRCFERREKSRAERAMQSCRDSVSAKGSAGGPAKTRADTHLASSTPPSSQTEGTDSSSLHSHSGYLQLASAPLLPHPSSRLTSVESNHHTSYPPRALHPLRCSFLCIPSATVEEEMSVDSGGEEEEVEDEDWVGVRLVDVQIVAAVCALEERGILNCCVGDDCSVVSGGARRG